MVGAQLSQFMQAYCQLVRDTEVLMGRALPSPMEQRITPGCKLWSVEVSHLVGVALVCTAVPPWEEAEMRG